MLRRCAVTAKRPFPNRNTLNAYRGCLRYGADWKWKRVTFQPHMGDKSTISNEKHKKCRSFQKSTSTIAQGFPIREISYTAERFGSSVYDDFSKTFSRIVFKITIRPIRERRVFVTSISASFSPAYLGQAQYYSRGFHIYPDAVAIENSVFSNVCPQEEDKTVKSCRCWIIWGGACRRRAFD